MLSQLSGNSDARIPTGRGLTPWPEMGWGHFLAALILETMMLQQGKYIHHSGMMLDNRGHFLFGFLSWQLMHFRF